jgi:hypothetical protein
MEYIFGLLILGLFIYEFFALASSRRGDTISEIIWDVTKKYPLIPFLFGMLMGHFFWQRQ